MTTVAALARDGHVWMAADSMINVYERPIPGGCRKIRRTKAGDGEALIGVAGTSGLVALTGMLNLDSPPDAGEDPQPWAETVAVQVTRLAVEHSLLDDGVMDGTLLLGWYGRLWTISHATAIPHGDGVAAAGSGEGPAIGAVDTLLAVAPDMPPAEVVTRAVAVAVARDRHSAAPVQLECLPRTFGP